MEKFIIASFLFMLSSCSQRTFNFKVKGSYSIVKREISSIKDSVVIKGMIKDKKNLTPIAYGVLNLSGTKIGVSSDSLGFFNLKIPSGNYKIHASCVGYTDLYTKAMGFKPNEIVTIDFYLGTTIIE